MLTKLPKHTYLILLTLLANLCYAINVVTNKESYNLLGNDITSVNAYMGIRTIIIGIVMWIIYSKINNERTKSQSFNVFDILIFVVMNTVLKRIFLNVGQIGLDNFTFSLLSQLSFLTTFVLMLLMRKSKLNRYSTVAIILSVISLTLVTKNTSNTSTVTLVGVICTLLGSVCMSVHTIYSRYCKGNLPILSSKASVIGGMVMLLGSLSGIPNVLNAVTPTLALLFTQQVVCNILAQVLLIYTVRDLHPTESSVLRLAEPAFTLLIVVSMTGTSLILNSLVSLTLVVMAVILLNKKGTSKNEEAN